MDKTDSRDSWARLFVIFLIASVGNVGMWSIVTVMPTIESEFLLDRSQASLPYTTTMIGFAIGNWFFGRLLDRFGLFYILLGATFLITTGFFVATFSTNILLFSIIQFFLGMGTAGSFAPLISDISHWFKKYRGIAVAIVASANYFSGAVSSLILVEMLNSSGWRFVYLILGLSCLVIVIPLGWVLHRKEIRINIGHNLTKVEYISSIKISHLTYLLGFAGISCCVAMSMPQVHIVSYCVGLGFGNIVGGQMLSLMLVGGVFSRLIFGLVADKLGGIKTLIIGSILQCLALLLYLPFDSLVSLYTVSFLFGLSQGGIVPSYAIVIREFMPEDQAGGKIGFVIMATIIGMAFGGLLSGWIFDLTGSYNAAFVNGIFWNCLNFGVIIFVFFNSKKVFLPIKQ
ncbi:MAG: MFS transporter [Paracoccaceae bacterium]|nr:MFS transporter [Paracoccaceae bacterium]